MILGRFRNRLKLYFGVNLDNATFPNLHFIIFWNLDHYAWQDAARLEKEPQIVVLEDVRLEKELQIVL